MPENFNEMLTRRLYKSREYAWESGVNSGCKQVINSIKWVPIVLNLKYMSVRIYNQSDISSIASVSLIKKGRLLDHFSTQGCRPRWLSWMRRPTGDQEVAGSTPAEVSNILSWRLIMKYFLRSFSPFRWFKKGSCQFLAKECAQYWLTA